MPIADVDRRLRPRALISELLRERVVVDQSFVNIAPVKQVIVPAARAKAVVGGSILVHIFFEDDTPSITIVIHLPAPFVASKNRIGLTPPGLLAPIDSRYISLP